MNDCLEKSVKLADAEGFAHIFEGKEEVRLLQTEFWGKWMHSAPVLAAYAGDDALKAKLRHRSRSYSRRSAPTDISATIAMMRTLLIGMSGAAST